MITKKFVRRQCVAISHTRKALRLCEGYISVKLEECWRPGVAVRINLWAEMRPLLHRPPQIALFYELVERLREAGWDVAHNLGASKYPDTVFFLIS